MNKKLVVVSVISDLVSDQRVHRICLYLHQKGATVLLIGRSFNNSLKVSERPYKTLRINCHYKKGPLQYIEFMLKLWIKFFFYKPALLVANDLDTLLPNYLHSVFRKIPLVYDSHEYFTGAPELRDRKFKKNIWKKLEGFLLPKIKTAYTVNNSIRMQYQKDYGIEMQVIRNMPFLNKALAISEVPALPVDRKILIMQGAGINPERGYEEAVLSMKFLNEDFLLVIAGSGTILEELKNLVSENNLSSKVSFIPKLPFETLPYLTSQASLGLSLDKPNSMNYVFSLPNKIFDYIHAGLPVITSSVPEVRKIVEEYKVGVCIDNITPENIADAIKEIFEDEDRLKEFRRNSIEAREVLNWENEQLKLDEIYSGYI